MARSSGHDAAPHLVQRDLPMLLSVGELWNEAQPAFDICIVGAGAAGITLALELRNTALKVCVLESGGLAYDRHTQDLARGEITGHPYYALSEARDRWLGGTTNSWSGECRPLDDLDFERRHWIANSGWPIARRDLDPFYEKAQEICQLGPSFYDDESLAGHDGAAGLLGAGPHAFKTRFFQYSPPTRFGIDYHRDLAAARNLFVFTHANVLQVICDDSGKRALAVGVARPDGATTEVRAGCFVLASGGLEVPRILLNSRETHAAGLGNTRGQLGRYFMEHLFVDNVLGFAHPIPAGAFLLLSRRFTWQGAKLRGAVAPARPLLAQERLPNFCFRITGPSSRAVAVSSLAVLLENLKRGRRPPRAVSHLGSVFRGWCAIADFAGRRVSQKLFGPVGREGLLCHLVAEQVPSWGSRVLLSRERDRFGQNRIELDWRLGEEDRAHIDHACAALAAAFARAGQPLVRSDGAGESGVRGGRHHMGTARMSESEKTGVVDRHGRVHGLQNLFVAGSAVFPTGGYANPTLTIVALAVRLARHLKECFGS